jgi:hypothetical protein
MWTAYRIQCALDELEHYTRAGIAGPIYTANVLLHVAELKDTMQ